MSTIFYTPATGYPDEEVKIAYGLARVGIEASGTKGVKIIPGGGYYIVEIDADINKLNAVFQLICRRLFSSSYIPSSTPGISSRSAETFTVSHNENYDLDVYRNLRNEPKVLRKKACDHDFPEVSNVIGLTSATSFPQTRDRLVVQGETLHRPTNPRRICKMCALLAILGTWFTTFFFYAEKKKEIIIIPFPQGVVEGLTLEKLFSFQHQVRKETLIDQEIPLVVIPLLFLTRVPSLADFLEGFQLYVSALSKISQGSYHVDGIFVLPVDEYLKFIRWSPYNVATIQLLVSKSKENNTIALSELNSLICRRERREIGKFARLYVQVTSSNKYTNLLYYKTAEYLLKEVAMIKPEIIENPAIASLARTLRYFIKKKKYSYVDNIRNARQDTREFEETIAKMLREGRLRKEQEKKEEQEEKIYLPNEEEIREVFRLANKDFESTKLTLVILASSFPAKGEELEEIEEEQNA